MKDELRNQEQTQLEFNKEKGNTNSNLMNSESPQDSNMMNSQSSPQNTKISRMNQKASRMKRRYDDDLDGVDRFKMGLDMVKKVHGKFNISDMFLVLKLFDSQKLRGRMKVAHQLLDEVIQAFLRERIKHRELKKMEIRSSYGGDLLDSLLDYS
ncbi:hypothetical protein SSX86_029751 [Deinandra increscens subsp. villosa]|uniref:Uncharacterized protein n=1 Tax=Deinandra increscens subsp. villosa TaxID=3103831 RepID=A0AAP0CBY0_9ASTR